MASSFTPSADKNRDAHPPPLTLCSCVGAGSWRVWRGPVAAARQICRISSFDEMIALSARHGVAARCFHVGAAVVESAMARRRTTPLTCAIAHVVGRCPASDDVMSLRFEHATASRPVAGSENGM